ncbi:unnamed protein product [Arabidopsis lyrata]|nr:unnamed protein product [Arabidopsis lyrata]
MRQRIFTASLFGLVGGFGFSGIPEFSSWICGCWFLLSRDLFCRLTGLFLFSVLLGLD